MQVCIFACMTVRWLHTRSLCMYLYYMYVMYACIVCDFAYCISPSLVELHKRQYFWLSSSWKESGS